RAFRLPVQGRWHVHRHRDGERRGRFVARGSRRVLLALGATAWPARMLPGAAGRRVHPPAHQRGRSVVRDAAMSARALALVLLAYASSALAYRPFDSTDADVAHAGEAEIELGPVQLLKEGSKRFVHVPAVIANVGFSHDRELVLEGKHQVALDREAD